jgi:hypothetical protein
MVQVAEYCVPGKVSSAEAAGGVGKCCQLAAATTSRARMRRFCARAGENSETSPRGRKIGAGKGVTNYS